VAFESPLVPRLLPQPEPIRQSASVQVIDPEGTYLITGGSGGLGGALLQWLLHEQCVPPEQLVLLSRRGGPPPVPGVRSLAVDVSSSSSLHACQALRSLPRLAGIFHLAGVLDDGLLMNMSAERVRTVVAPKAGVLELLALCRQNKLTPPWVMLASSTSSLLGYAGQSNYCAANALFDQAAAFGLSAVSQMSGVAACDCAIGIPVAHEPIPLEDEPTPWEDEPAVLTLNFGPWGEVGMAREGTKAHQLSLESGERPMSSALAVACISKALSNLQSEVTVGGRPARLQYCIADIEWWRSPWPTHSLIQGFLRRMPKVVHAEPVSETSHIDAGSSKGGAMPVDGFKSVDGGGVGGTQDGRELVEAWMKGRLSTWEEEKPLGDLGLDSLDLVQLRNAFNKHFRKEGRLSDEVPLSVFSNANQTLIQLMDKVGALLSAS